MITLTIFIILFFGIFGKLISLAFRATWGLTKIIFTLVFFPFILIFMVFGGLLSLALPLLIIVGIIAILFD